MLWSDCPHRGWTAISQSPYPSCAWKIIRWPRSRGLVPGRSIATNTCVVDADVAEEACSSTWLRFPAFSDRPSSNGHGKAGEASEMVPSQPSVTRCFKNIDRGKKQDACRVAATFWPRDAIMNPKPVSVLLCRWHPTRFVPLFRTRYNPSLPYQAVKQG